MSTNPSGMPFQRAANIWAVMDGRYAHGTGNVNWTRFVKEALPRVQCPICGGTGKKDGDTCPRCQGDRDVPVIHYETMRKILSGERKLDGKGDREKDIRDIEIVAEAFGADPTTAKEYNVLIAQRAFDASVVGEATADENLALWIDAGRRKKGGRRRPELAPAFA